MSPAAEGRPPPVMLIRPTLHEDRRLSRQVGGPTVPGEPCLPDVGDPVLLGQGVSALVGVSSRGSQRSISQFAVV